MRPCWVGSQHARLGPAIGLERPRARCPRRRNLSLHMEGSAEMSRHEQQRRGDAASSICRPAPSGVEAKAWPSTLWSIEFGLWKPYGSWIPKWRNSSFTTSMNHLVLVLKESCRSLAVSLSPTSIHLVSWTGPGCPVERAQSRYNWKWLIQATGSGWGCPTTDTAS